MSLPRQLVFALLLVIAPLASHGQENASPPPARKNTLEERQRAIRELGDGRFEVRKEASHFLWQCGLAAQLLLEQVVAGDNPEAATRAKRILERFAKKDVGKLPPDRAGRFVLCALQLRSNFFAMAGVLNEKPTERELKEFFAAIPDREERRRAVAYLSAYQDHLIRIARDEGIERAESYIETAAASGHPDAVRRWVAYLVVTDRAGKVCKGLEKRAAAGTLGELRLPLLSALRYATGDHDKALELAEEIDYKDVKLSVLYQRGDWIAIGDAVAETATTDPARRAVRLHAAQLAGDRELADKILAESLAKEPPRYGSGNYIPLLLENHIDDFAKALGQRKPLSPSGRCHLLLALGRLDEAKRIAPKTGLGSMTQEFPGIVEVPPEQAAAVPAKKFDADEFIENLRRTQRACFRERSLPSAMEKIKAWHSDPKPYPWKLEQAVGVALPDRRTAFRLYKAIKATDPQASTQEVMERVASYLYIDAPLEPVRRLVEEGLDSPLKPKDMSDAEWLQLIAAICWTRCLEKEATEYLRRSLSAGGCPFRLALTLLPSLPQKERAPLLRTVARRALLDDKLVVGAVQALAACEFAEPAGGNDVPLHALLATDSEGHSAYIPWIWTRFLEPLGTSRDADSADNLRRYARIPGFSRHNDMVSAFLSEERYAEAIKEIRMRELLLLARAASHGWTGQMSLFTRLRQLRIAALLGMGKREKAMQLLHAAAVWAGDDYCTIGIVNMLDEAGLKEEADWAFDIAYRTQGGAYHGRASPTVMDLNNLAWLCARCGRELESAQTYVLRALEYSPYGPAYNDTLAHVLAGQGKFDEAVKVQRRVVALVPWDGLGGHGFRASLRKFVAQRDAK
ncbi:MAG: hypothetical protein KAI66_05965 [Lentisphaeria bacterium]|nr:hypothetical protein [Lentisphaeria bacterium]